MVENHQNQCKMHQKNLKKASKNAKWKNIQSKSTKKSAKIVPKKEEARHENVQSTKT